MPTKLKAKTVCLRWNLCLCFYLHQVFIHGGLLRCRHQINAGRTEVCMDGFCISDMMKRRKHSTQFKLLLDLFGWIQASASDLLPASGAGSKWTKLFAFYF